MSSLGQQRRFGLPSAASPVSPLATLPLRRGKRRFGPWGFDMLQSVDDLIGEKFSILLSQAWRIVDHQDKHVVVTEVAQRRSLRHELGIRYRSGLARCSHRL